jgi:hypothetical protein
MKNQIKQLILALVLLSALNAQLSTAQAQGTAFTYQGRLNAGGSPASGTYNLTFSLFNTNTTGVAIAGPVTNNAVVVTNGLFTVLIDFGPGVFTGASNWLEIAVATNGTGSFTTLAPRQQLTPTPYAVFAESSSNLLGTLPASQLITSVGFENFFVGPSGNSTMTGSYNAANGNSALGANTIGSYNTADGTYALANNTSGYFNTANGFQALLQNLSGSLNTANGFGALYNNYNGSYNTADGAEALYDNFNGSNNIALGYKAGYNLNGNESSNIDIGNQGLSTDTNIIRIGSGQSQTFIAGVINGNGGGLTNLNISASQLPAAVVTNTETGVILSGTFSGNGSGLTSLSASQLTSIGNTNGGSDNFFAGPSGNSTTSGGGNTAIGSGALTDNTSGGGNTANGDLALGFNTIGLGNTANGFWALVNNTNGSQNTADGNTALADNTRGSYNTADGVNALLENTSGSNNIALGFDAGYNITTGSFNIDIGNQGLATDTNIIRIGSSQSQAYIAGVIVGDGSGLINITASKLTGIGNNNFFAGSAGNAANSGSDNTAMGAQALTNNTSGTGNTAFGFGALQNATGNFNFGYGYLAGSGLTTGVNNVDIAAAGQSSDTAIIRIGTPGIQTATYFAGISGATAASGVAVYVNSSGQLGTLTSSRRYKQDIQGMDQASDVLYALQPVTFKYKPGIDPQGIPQFGLVAEDVEKVAPDLVARDDQGKIYTVRYQAVDAMLLNEFLKEHRTVEEQTRTVQEQSAEIQNLKQQNESLEKRLNKLEKAVARIGEKSGATFALNSKATENK